MSRPDGVLLCLNFPRTALPQGGREQTALAARWFHFTGTRLVLPSKARPRAFQSADAFVGEIK